MTFAYPQGLDLEELGDEAWGDLICDLGFTLSKFHSEQEMDDSEEDETSNPGTEASSMKDLASSAHIISDISMIDMEALKASCRDDMSFRIDDSTFANISSKRLQVLKTLVSALQSSQTHESIRTFGSSNYHLEVLEGNLNTLDECGPNLWPEKIPLFENVLMSSKILWLQYEDPDKLEDIFDQIMRYVQHSIAADDFNSLRHIVQFSLSCGHPRFVTRTVKLLLKVYVEHSGAFIRELQLDLDDLFDFARDVDVPALWACAHQGSTRIKFEAGFNANEASIRSVVSDGKFLYCHGTRGLDKIGTGLQGTVAGKVYCRNSKYFPGDSLRLAFASGMLFSCSQQSIWSTIQEIDTKSLHTIRTLRLGSDPEHGCPINHASIPLFFSDGESLFLIGREQCRNMTEEQKASETLTAEHSPSSPLLGRRKRSVDEVPKRVKKSTSRLVLYCYDPTKTVVHGTYCEEPLLELSESERVKINERRSLAEQLWKATGYHFTLDSCVIALLNASSDLNASARWLLDNGELLRTSRDIPLKQRIVLEAVQPYDTTIDVLDRSPVIFSGHQIVIMIQPYNGPWSEDDKFMVRSYAISDGSHIGDLRGTHFEFHSSDCISFDVFNNTIWSLQSNDGFRIEQYENKGPQYCLDRPDRLKEDSFESLGRQFEYVPEKVSEIILLLTSLCEYASRLRLCMNCPINPLKLQEAIDREVCNTSLSMDDAKEVEVKDSEDVVAKSLQKIENLQRTKKSVGVSPIAPSEIRSSFCFELEQIHLNSLQNLIVFTVDSLTCPSADPSLLLFLLKVSLELFHDQILAVPSDKSVGISSEFHKCVLDLSFEYVYKGSLGDKFTEIRFLAQDVLMSSTSIFFPDGNSKVSFLQKLLRSSTKESTKGETFICKYLHCLSGMQDVCFLFLGDSKSLQCLRDLSQLLRMGSERLGSSILSFFLSVQRTIFIQTQILESTTISKVPPVFLTYTLLVLEESCRDLECGISDPDGSFLKLLYPLLPSFEVISDLDFALKVIPYLLETLRRLNQLEIDTSHSDAAFLDHLVKERSNEYVIETAHPYPSGHNVLRETIEIPGACAILLQFDSRSCTKNNTDALYLYNDPSLSAKLAHGPFSGNRFDRNANWPSKGIIVDGSSITMVFSARSQPDESDGSRWGFRCIVRGLYLPQLHWKLDLECCLSSSIASMGLLLIDGTEIDPLEEELEEWLSSGICKDGVDEGDNSFWDTFLHGNASSELMEVFGHHGVRFMGQSVISRLSSDTQLMWSRTIRGVAAALFKHSGAFDDIASTFLSHSAKSRIVSISSIAHEFQNWMLREIQLAKQWVFLVHDENLSFDLLWDELGHVDALDYLQGICEQLSIPFDANSIKETIETLLQYLYEKRKDEQFMNISRSTNEYCYQRVCHSVLASVHQLLAFKVSHETLNEDLVIPDLVRSRSEQHFSLDEPFLSRATTEPPKPQSAKLTDWISSYKQWKSWRSASTLKRFVSPSKSVIDSVLSFLKFHVSSGELLRLANLQKIRAQHRITGLESFTTFLSIVSSDAARLQFLGNLHVILDRGIYTSISMLPTHLRQTLSLKFNDLVSKLVDLFVKGNTVIKSASIGDIYAIPFSHPVSHIARGQNLLSVLVASIKSSTSEDSLSSSQWSALKFFTLYAIEWDRETVEHQVHDLLAYFMQKSQSPESNASANQSLFILLQFLHILFMRFENRDILQIPLHFAWYSLETNTAAIRLIRRSQVSKTVLHELLELLGKVLVHRNDVPESNKSIPWILTIHLDDSMSVGQYQSLLLDHASEYLIPLEERKRTKEDETRLQEKADGDYIRRRSFLRFPQEQRKVQLRIEAGQAALQDEGVYIGTGGFSTLIGEVGVVSGKWYYEVVIETKGIHQIGWATSRLSTDPSRNGIGDDKHSWAFDGNRLKVWHVDAKNYGGMRRWKAGDVVGVLIDMDERTMSFRLNERDLGPAFTNFDSGGEDELFPAISFSKGEKGKVLFHYRDFNYELPKGYYPLEGDHGIVHKTNPKTKSQQIASEIYDHGFAKLMEGSLSECCVAAQTLSQHGVLITTDISKEVKCKFPVYSSNSIATFTSELISLLRKCCKGLAQKHLVSILKEDGSVFEKLGALAVCGGFVEPLRIGGSVQCNGSIGTVLLLQSQESIVLVKDKAQTLSNHLLHPVPLFTAPILKLDKPLITALSSYIERTGESWLSHQLQYRALMCLGYLLNGDVSEDALAEAHRVLGTIGETQVAFSMDGGLSELRLLEGKLWDLYNVQRGLMYPPFPRESAEKPYISETSVEDETLFCYASSFLQNAPQVVVEGESRMLKFWEKHIIPRIQEYVRGSFKEYEMEYFFESLRQPLRSGNQEAAIKIAFTLCGGRVPDGVLFPSQTKDWSALMIDDVKAGDVLLYNGKKVTVKAVVPHSENVLLQIFDEQRSVVSVKSVLVEHCRASGESGDSFLSKSDVMAHLKETQKGLVCLLARRYLFSRACKSLKVLDQRSSDLNSLFRFVFMIVSEDLVGSSLEPQVSTLLENNLTRVLQKYSKEDIASTALDFMDSMITFINDFITTHQTIVKTSAMEKQTSAFIKINGSSLLILLLPREAMIDPQSFLKLIQSQSTIHKITSTSRPPFILIKDDTVVLHRSSPSLGILRLDLKVIPVPPQFSVLLWFIRYLQTIESSDPFTATIALKLFNGFHMDRMEPSPLKESLVNVLNLLGLSMTQILSLLAPTRSLHEELFSLMALEESNDFSTSYVQTLVQHFVTFEDKNAYTVSLDEALHPLAGQPEEKEEIVQKDDGWSCAICTFINPDMDEACGMCGSPKILAVQPIDTSATIDQKAIDRSKCRCKGYVYLRQLLLFLMDLPHDELVSRHALETAWNDIKSDQMDDRMIVIENIPSTPSSAENVLSLLRNTVKHGRIASSNFFLLQKDKMEPESPPPNAKQLVLSYESDFDENGLLYYLGTEFLTKPWRNPCLSGKVEALCSSLQSDSEPVSSICGRTAVRCVSQALEGSWFEIKLNDVSICPSKYTLKHYSSWNHEALRSWRFEGSNDGIQWILLREHDSDESLKRKGDTASWDIQTDECFSRFRVLQTNINSNGNLYLALSGLELYGVATGDGLRIRPPPSSTNRFVVCEVEEGLESVVSELDGMEVSWDIEETCVFSVQLLTESCLFPVFLRHSMDDYTASDVVDEWNRRKSEGYNLRNEKVFSTSLEENIERMTAFKASHSISDTFRRIEDSCQSSEDPNPLHLPVSRLSTPSPGFSLWFTVLKLFNQLFSDILPIINLTDEILPLARVFLFRSSKMSVLRRILDFTSNPRDKVPVLTLHRMELRQSQKDIPVLSTAFRQLGHLPPHLLRPPRPAGAEPFLAFEVILKGEQVVGEGGPYRQFFTDLSNELVQSFLFVKTPNHSAGLGDGRNLYTIRPSAVSPECLDMFEFLGILFGFSIRTNVRFALDLPAFVWKLISESSVSVADLRQMDVITVNALEAIGSSEIDEKTFNESFSDTFETMTSDQSIVELIEGGSSRRVTFSERHQFVHLTVNVRLHEIDAQIEAIRKGLGKVVPLQCLSLFSWEELEQLISGKSDIDIQLLRRHTKYSGVSPDEPHVLFFWNVLTQFSQRDRRAFVRFAWAQERLPSDDEEFIQSHTRFLIKDSTVSGDPDLRFPRADTCFFNLELPRYSSAEILEKRLLFAIHNTDTMNADEGAGDLHGQVSPA